MQIAAPAHAVARTRTTAAARRPARGGTGGVRAVVALLLLLLMPLGLLHRSSTAACRHDGRSAVAGNDAAVSSAGASGAGLDAPSGASAEQQERAVVVGQHDHHDDELLPYGAAPGACGPGALAEHPASAKPFPSRDVGPPGRAHTPRALAAPPPAPPPRLS
jgi:hypothetical protein